MIPEIHCFPAKKRHSFNLPGVAVKPTVEPDFVARIRHTADISRILTPALSQKWRYSYCMYCLVRLFLWVVDSLTRPYPYLHKAYIQPTWISWWKSLVIFGGCCVEWLGKGVRHAFSDEKWKAKLKPLPNLWWEGLFSMIVLEINLKGLVDQSINDMCSMWVSMLFMPAWPHRSPKVLVESHITSPWHIVFSTKVNTVWLFRAWLHNPIVATSISIVSWLQKLLGVVTRLFHDNPCNLHCKHHEILSRLNSCLRFGKKWWDG